MTEVNASPRKIAPLNLIFTDADIERLYRRFYHHSKKTGRIGKIRNSAAETRPFQPVRIFRRKIRCIENHGIKISQIFRIDFFPSMHDSYFVFQRKIKIRSAAIPQNQNFIHLYLLYSANFGRERKFFCVLIL